MSSTVWGNHSYRNSRREHTTILRVDETKDSLRSNRQIQMLAIVAALDSLATDRLRKAETDLILQLSVSRTAGFPDLHGRPARIEAPVER